MQTWIPNPVVGDLYYENVYTQYREVGGVQIPRFHQHQDYDDGAHTPNVSGGDHAFGLETVSSLEANPSDAALDVPDMVRTARVPPTRVESQSLGDGLWLIGGGSHHSVAIEFGDHVAVIEAPLNETRSLAVIDEVDRIAPGKPIRFIVTTHHHWDHVGGLRAYVHDGATVITHEGNKPYYQEVLRAGPWLLEPDRFSLHPPEEWSEGYIFETLNEKYVLADATRVVELYHVQGLAHAAGMLMALSPPGADRGAGRPLQFAVAGTQRQLARPLSQCAASESGGRHHRRDPRDPGADVRVRGVHRSRPVSGRERRSSVDLAPAEEAMPAHDETGQHQHRRTQ